MRFIIYKTTNLITNQFYIGQHSTEDIDDGYLGSGTGLLESIKEFGKESFSREILHDFDTFEEMNEKEKELVTEDVIRNPLCLNRQIGGSCTWMTKNTVIVAEGNKWVRIFSSDYDKTQYLTPTSGSIQVFDSRSSDEKKRIPVEEFHSNRERYRHPTDGKVSVIDKETGKTKSIRVSDFDANAHKKVLGGIVSVVDGIPKYVTKEEFYDGKLRGIHENKITVRLKQTGEIKHIEKEEFYNNRSSYFALTEGFVTAYDIESGEKIFVSTEEFHKNKQRYRGQTTGQITVWCKTEQRYKNIKTEEFDRRKHNRSSDRYIKCVDGKNNTVFEFIGGKKEFLEKFDAHLYHLASNNVKKYKPTKKQFEHFEGYSFIFIKWKDYVRHQK